MRLIERKRVWVVAAGAAAMASGLGWSFASAADAEKKPDDAAKPKYTIGEVMEKAHKGDTALVRKVQAGKASKEELAQILEYYKALIGQDPPKGDTKSWRAKTHALVEATEALAKGDPKGQSAFKAAVNCKACHSAHRAD